MICGVRRRFGLAPASAALRLADFGTQAGQHEAERERSIRQTLKRENCNWPHRNAQMPRNCSNYGANRGGKTVSFEQCRSY